MVTVSLLSSGTVIELNPGQPVPLNFIGDLKYTGEEENAWVVVNRILARADRIAL
jgi:hypothetical protein